MASAGAIVAPLIGVLLAALLLGVTVWVVGILALAWLVSRKTITVAGLVKAGLAMGAAATGYVAAVILIGYALSP